MILLSDELWLIANNFKGFANRNKSISRNNLGLCKHSNTYVYPVDIAKFLGTAIYIEHL